MKQKISITLDEQLIKAIRLAAKKGHRNVSQEFEKSLLPIYLGKTQVDTDE